MAKVIENSFNGRKKILLSSYDVVSIVRIYQDIVQNTKKYDDVVDLLNEHEFFLPEDF